MTHEEFEYRLMQILLAGDEPVLDGLRNQYLNSTIGSTNFTGAGFYTHYKIKASSMPVAGGLSFHFGDVLASTIEVDIAFGFVVFIKYGLLDFLEGYTLGSKNWPTEYSNVSLKYDGHEGNRDLEELKKVWASS